MINKLRNQYITIFLTILLILFLILLGFYPGVVPYDGNNQWQQVQSGVITNAHPFFSTYFMSLLSKICNSVTIVIIYQIVLFSIAWSYLCKVLKASEKKQIILMYIFTILVVLLPITCIYQITLWKDIIYTSYLFLCAVMLYDWSNNNYEFSVFKYSIFGVILAMVFSYRHNGIIVAALMLCTFYIFCIKKYKNNIITKSNLKKCFCVLVSFIIILLIISIPKKIILEHSSKKTKSSEVSVSTIDGYITWMMGAHIKDNNITSKSDKKFLNNIIPLKQWRKAYNPYLINDTNLAENFNKKYLANHRTHFRNLFMKYSVQKPLTIINHYLRSDALLINPVSSLDGYVYVYPFNELKLLPKYTVIKPKLKFVNFIYHKFIGLSLRKPFIIFYEPAFILYLSLILTLILSKRVYGKKIWLFIFPMLFNTISLLPINLAQDLRYVYINYLTFFGLGLLVIINYKSIFKIKKH